MQTATTEEYIWNLLFIKCASSTSQALSAV